MPEWKPHFKLFDISQGQSNSLPQVMREACGALRAMAHKNPVSQQNVAALPNLKKGLLNNVSAEKA